MRSDDEMRTTVYARAEVLRARRRRRLAVGRAAAALVLVATAVTLLSGPDEDDQRVATGAQDTTTTSQTSTTATTPPTSTTRPPDNREPAAGTVPTTPANTPRQPPLRWAYTDVPILTPDGFLGSGTGIMDLVTGEFRELAGGGNNVNVSPDRSRIVYAQGGELYIAAAGGFNPQVVALPEGDAYLASWSPDQRKLVIATTSAIYLADADGNDPQPITGGTIWSPDGTMLADDHATSVLTIATGAVQQLDPPDDVAQVLWRPDQTGLLVKTPTGHANVPLDGSASTPFTAIPAGASLGAFSPDGRHISYKRDQTIVVASADGTNPRDVATEVTSNFGPPWSPDGKALLYTTEAPPGPDGAQQRYLTVLWLDTGEVIQRLQRMSFGETW